MRRLVLTMLMFAGGCVNALAPTAPSGAPTADGGTSDPACQIQTDAQHTPGYPFDLPTFKTVILPVLSTTCAGAGCHAAPTGQASFNLWADAAPGNCSYAKTFNSFKAHVDLATPENSPVYIAISGSDAAHPINYGPDNPTSKAFLSFIQNAAATQAASATGAGGGGGTTAPPSANPFDYAVYQTTIQPILDSTDTKGCSAAACHGGPLGTGGFKLVRAPAPGSADMQTNFDTVTGRANPADPAHSDVYLQATTRHGGGASALMSATESATFLDWITKAKANTAPTGGGTTCPAPTNFDENVFRDEIMPILTGAVDLNNRNNTTNVNSCTRSGCHGDDRTGGALVLKSTWTPAQNLASFACFVNLTNPTASEILVCPLNQAGCRRNPHPGQVVFANSTDLNYQRILSYIYGSKTVSTPLDFAFFARRINPIFQDPAATIGGNGRTCTDGGCHGIAVAGQPAPGGSNFPILSQAQDRPRLLINFAAAANFTNFIQATGSSLFLYPTNQIANLANPYATGLPHPGGADIAVDSQQARDILTWARGLRPDGQGFQNNWLVAGDFAAAQITDLTAVDEVNVAPSLFTKSGAVQFNNGEWDGLFSDRQSTDLNAEFPRAAQTGRVAYAVAYLINTTGQDLQANLTVISPNAVKMFVGKNALLQSNDARNGVSGLTTLPAYAVGHSSTRVLVKVFQRANDQQFSFQLLLTDQFGTAFTDTTGELVVKLSPDGGI